MTLPVLGEYKANMKAAVAIRLQVENTLMKRAFALDIRGMNAIYGCAEQLAMKLRQRVMTAGFIVKVAVAENFHAAGCLSWGWSGTTVVRQGEEACTLAPLPLSVLPLEPPHIETVKSWDVRTYGELASLVESDLISRLEQGRSSMRWPAAHDHITWSHSKRALKRTSSNARNSIF
ncbi:hypothetical protein GCM10011585_34410 [Edaphobacter dinghuensis]|uniref:Uncharacterized protein n=2 Tax=Edaphobacter dinghuensis TaxID=1560005 RepID=A0A917HQZ9_9BACT|nr:hypothetical protein GCM10011585_34410 [Edaphobacter dinghuensis]